MDITDKEKKLIDDAFHAISENMNKDSLLYDMLNMVAKQMDEIAALKEEIKRLENLVQRESER